ncbi:MAG: 4Fe-4S dicluster domain-containing protein [Gammaproteobacteria bacterium]
MSGTAEIAVVDLLPAGEGVRHVSYSSAGQLLVIAPADAAAVGERLPRHPAPVILTNSGQQEVIDGSTARVIRGQALTVAGHLGRFRVIASVGDREVDLGRTCGTDTACFDLVLDLSAVPLLQRPVLPPGYFAPGTDPAALDQALDSLVGLVGDFEKPRYFHYRQDLCAHGGTEASGCNRCLEACGAEAITSLDHAIEVDPWLCQGCGACSTVCPSGAIRYNYPPPATVLEQVQRALEGVPDGTPTSIVFYSDPELTGAKEAVSEDSCLFVRVEDTGSIGGDVMLPAICYGADRVVVALSEQAPATTTAALREEVNVYNRILAGLGCGENRLHATTGSGGLAASLAQTPAMLALPRATFGGFNEKRTMLDLAVDHLYRHSQVRERYQPLPAPAPFGNVNVDRSACTLCMACAGICPAGALRDGGGEPVLKFIEANCVQCGACAEICPEQVIQLQPRIDYDRDAAKNPRVLNEDEAVYCEDCGKAFGTRSMIAAISAKLKDHWMYQTHGDRNLMRLCGECRAKRALSAQKETDRLQVEQYRDGFTRGGH